MVDNFLSIWSFLNTQFVSTLISTVFGGAIVLYFTERYRKGNLFIELTRQVHFYSRLITPYGSKLDTYKKNHPDSVITEIDFVLDFYNSSQDEKIIKQAKVIIQKPGESETFRIEHGKNRFFNAYTFPPKHLTQLNLSCSVDRHLDIENYTILFQYKDENNKEKIVPLHLPDNIN